MRLEGTCRPNLTKTLIAVVDNLDLISVIGAPDEAIDREAFH